MPRNSEQSVEFVCDGIDGDEHECMTFMVDGRFSAYGVFEPYEDTECPECGESADPTDPEIVVV